MSSSFYFFPSVLFLLFLACIDLLWKNTDHFWPNCKGYLLPLLVECNHSRKERESELKLCWHVFWNMGILNLPLETHPNPRCFKSSLNPHLSSPVYCDCPVTFLHKGQRPHTEQMREQEAELTLRSLCGSTHPQGETVHWPDRLKLATTLQDGCLNAPSISSAAYTFILNLAELSLSFSGWD